MYNSYSLLIELLKGGSGCQHPSKVATFLLLTNQIPPPNPPFSPFLFLFLLLLLLLLHSINSPNNLPPTVSSHFLPDFRHLYFPAAFHNTMADVAELPVPSPVPSRAPSVAPPRPVPLDPRYDHYDFPYTSAEPRSGHAGHTTPEQDEKVTQLREQLEKLGYTERLDTLSMLRFLRARKFDVEAAKNMYVSFLRGSTALPGLYRSDCWLTNMIDWAGLWLARRGGKSSIRITCLAPLNTMRRRRSSNTIRNTTTRRTR